LRTSGGIQTPILGEEYDLLDTRVVVVPSAQVEVLGSPHAVPASASQLPQSSPHSSSPNVVPTNLFLPTEAGQFLRSPTWIASTPAGTFPVGTAHVPQQCLSAWNGQQQFHSHCVASAPAGSLLVPTSYVPQQCYSYSGGHHHVNVSQQFPCSIQPLGPAVQPLGPAVAQNRTIINGFKNRCQKCKKSHRDFSVCRTIGRIESGPHQGKKGQGHTEPDPERPSRRANSIQGQSN
jgi:hypothetical protein